MTEGFAMIDGRLMPLSEASVSITDVGFSHGYSIFETMLAGGRHDVTPNLVRLRRSAEATLLDLPPDDLLRAEIEAVRERVGERALVRITITGDQRRIVWATPIDDARRHAPVRCATVKHAEQGYLSGAVKHRSRMGWMVAIKRMAVDEILMVDARGRFTEGSSCAVLAVIGGEVWTAPWDGRILASTTLGRLLGHCERLGITVRREGAPASGPLDALYVASTTRSIAPVIALDGRSMPATDPIGRRLTEEEDR